ALAAEDATAMIPRKPPGGLFTSDQLEVVFRRREGELDMLQRYHLIFMWAPNAHDQGLLAVDADPVTIRNAIRSIEANSSVTPRKGPDSPGEGAVVSREVLRTTLRRFHLVVQELKRRHGCRPALEMKDEYDVQDILRALLRVHVGDLRPEETTPSKGG